jgi:uncharacterized protein YktA (UPF0223 family)
VAKLEIKEEVNWNKWIQGNQCHGGYKQTREIVRCKSNGKEVIKEKNTELDKSSIKDEINEEG